FGARPFATAGMLLTALTFGLLTTLPVNFSYVFFGLLLFLMGLSMGIFSSPNQAGIMNSLPPESRGVGAGMVNTFMNSAQVLSIGVFFTLMVLGLASGLPHAMYSGLVAQGVSPAAARRVSQLPPVGSLFASFLGYNPMQQLLGASTLAALPHSTASYLTGRSFFPHLISKPFSTGLNRAFTFAIFSSLVAAGASWLRGGKYVHTSADEGGETRFAPVGPVSIDDGGDPTLIGEPGDELAETRASGRI
ncbi:MAG: major facilitator superfamily 1, partial [Acidimicrobiaceae bacterium]|nr:major facilitator superfamily 1 [Acidimicrobiaceae bacterium]